MADTPKPAPTRRTGLSPKEQRLQALRDKIAAKNSGGAKNSGSPAAGGFHAKSNVARKTSFQRKAT